MGGVTVDTGALIAVERADRRMLGLWTAWALARVAGRALAELRLGREHTIDAIVMASAAQRGDVVYTSDFEDLTRLTGCFPAVRVLGV